MIKVLGLALYGPLAASNRYRLGQYVSGLASMGIDLQIRYLLGDQYLKAQFSGKAMPIATMAKDVLVRFSDLWHQNDYDLAILHCELFPLMPGSIERSLLDSPKEFGRNLNSSLFFLNEETDD
jgi:hypothetical protein